MKHIEKNIVLSWEEYQKLLTDSKVGTPPKPSEQTVASSLLPNHLISKTEQVLKPIIQSHPITEQTLKEPIAASVELPEQIIEPKPNLESTPDIIAIPVRTEQKIKPKFSKARKTRALFQPLPPGVGIPKIRKKRISKALNQLLSRKSSNWIQLY
jgi:hypothetical protein